MAHTQTRRTDRGARIDVVFICVGAAVLVVGPIVVRDGSVSDVEEGVVRAVNDLPDVFNALLWPFQQSGVLFVGPLVALVATALRHHRLTIAVLVATAAKLVLELVVKAAVTRDRPGTSIGPDIHARGTSSRAGRASWRVTPCWSPRSPGSYRPTLPGRWKALPSVLVGLVMVGRVSVGAHNPLDVLCGAALGLVIAGAINVATGTRRQPAARERPRAPNRHSRPSRSARRGTRRVADGPSSRLDIESMRLTGPV